MITAFYTENRKLWEVAGGGAGPGLYAFTAAEGKSWLTGNGRLRTKQTCLLRYRNNILPDLQSELPSIQRYKARST